jgi:hypothetical protein
LNKLFFCFLSGAQKSWMNGKLIAMLYHKGAQLFTVSSGKMQLALFARKLASQAAGTEHMVSAINYVFTI